MLPTNATELPNVSEILRPLLQRVPPEQQPLLIAFAERLAAERYRGWARESTNETRRAQLEECAAREDEIARRIEALYPEAATIQRKLLDNNPELEARYWLAVPENFVRPGRTSAR